MPVKVSKLVKKTPAKSQPVTFATPRPFEKQAKCLACEYSSLRDGLLDLGDGPLSPEAMPICPFCATYFAPQAPLPEKVSTLTAIDLIGAWYDFSDKLLNYHGNLSRLYHRAKVQCEEVLPEALDGWIRGDWSVGYTNAIKNNEEFPLFDFVWPMLMHERLLARTATAYGYVEALFETRDAEAIQRAIAHPEVLPVWELFLAACANRPPRADMTQQEMWALRAE